MGKLKIILEIRKLKLLKLHGSKKILNIYIKK